MCKWIPRIVSSGTNPLFLFNSKLRRGDPFTDSTLCGGTFFREPCKSKLISFMEIFLIFCFCYLMFYMLFIAIKFWICPTKQLLLFSLKERKEKSKRQSSLLPLGCKVKLLCCSLTIDKAVILVWQWKITGYDNNGKPANYIKCSNILSSNGILYWDTLWRITYQ